MLAFDIGEVVLIASLTTIFPDLGNGGCAINFLACDLIPCGYWDVEAVVDAADVGLSVINRDTFVIRKRKLDHRIWRTLRYLLLTIRIESLIFIISSDTPLALDERSDPTNWKTSFLSSGLMSSQETVRDTSGRRTEAAINVAWQPETRK